MMFAEAAALDPDDNPGELEAGKWVPTPRTTWRHGELMLKVGMVRCDAAERGRAGELPAPRALR